jgi:hypothetical protein
VTPSRGPGGIQAGTPRREPAPAPEDDARPETENTMSRPASTPEADEEQPASRQRISFGESEDLLADVDTEVNENEFKW